MTEHLEHARPLLEVRGLTKSFLGQRALDGVDLVLRCDGSLKGEHGTGRNVAPFVEAEWGAAAYAIMQETKSLFDPHGILNPGVIINRDPHAHLLHLKAMPRADAETDKCIECGFCETHCPSRDLTLTPRQRIIVRREMQRNPAVELEREFREAR